jgi:PHP family Zn ribbon phosphoesterase
VGVEYRVSELADRQSDVTKPHKVAEYIVPLAEVIALVRRTKSASGKGVQAQYFGLIEGLGTEISILRNIPVSQIATYDPEVAIAIDSIRKNQVQREPGYDGVYGTIVLATPD